jgi:hypothetical protein
MQMYVMPNLNEAQIEPVFLHTKNGSSQEQCHACVFRERLNE